LHRIKLSPFRMDALERLADPSDIRKVQEDLPIYIFSGSDAPVGQKLAGVRVLIDLYGSAGITSIVHDFYQGGPKCCTKQIAAM
jgi:hypothetical protein